MISLKLIEWLAPKFEFNPDYKTISDAHWQNTTDWESWASSEEDYWWDSVHADRLTSIANLWNSDPVAAFNGYKEMAEVGSAHAMIWLGHCYDRGHGTDASFNNAYDSYDRAIDAGSWLATLDIAALLFKHECYDECEEFLKWGVESDFMPAYYWLSWYRIQRSKNRATFKAVEPLLARAAVEGHPQARGFFAAAMAFGYFGWQKIPRGLKLMRADIRQSRKWREENYKLEPQLNG